jgi:hypothetical protein
MRLEWFTGKPNPHNLSNDWFDGFSGSAASNDVPSRQVLGTEGTNCSGGLSIWRVTPTATGIKHVLGDHNR